jgi:hypothetical protein
VLEQGYVLLSRASSSSVAIVPCVRCQTYAAVGLRDAYRREVPVQPGSVLLQQSLPCLSHYSRSELLLLLHTRCLLNLNIAFLLVQAATLVPLCSRTTEVSHA